MTVTHQQVRERWALASGLDAVAIPYDADEVTAGLVGLRAAGMTGPNDVLLPLVAAVLDAARLHREQQVSDCP